MLRITRPAWVDYTSAEVRMGWDAGRRGHGRQHGGLRYAAGYAAAAMLR